MRSFFIASTTSFVILLNNNPGYAMTIENKIIYDVYNPTDKPWNENATATARYAITTNVLGQLLEIDKNFNITSKYLDKFDWDYNTKEYILRLKKGLRFQNNREITSKDLEFSLLRTFFAKKSNEGSMYFRNIKGLENIKHGEVYKSGKVHGIKIINNLTITVKPNTPNPTFLYTISRSNYSLVPIEEFNEDLTTWKKWPIGAGSYKIKEINLSEGLFELELVNSEEKSPKNVIISTKKNLTPDITFDKLRIDNNKSYKTSRIAGYIGKRVIM